MFYSLFFQEQAGIKLDEKEKKDAPTKEGEEQWEKIKKDFSRPLKIRDLDFTDLMVSQI